MEKSLEVVALQGPLKLDLECFGYWKVSIKQVISSIDMKAWFAVEDGWSHPTEKNEKGELVQKHRKKWTAEEKAESKHNSQALSVIFKSLPRDIFNQVQGCESAKKAWDIRVITFEGTCRVRRTRLDNLASDFENLQMTETESVADYSSRLSGIAQESVGLGKRYKDKKLVKKFLRSLPDKFQLHKSAIDVSLNSDELKYNQVIGMMQVFEMQLKKKEKMNAKSFALKAIEEQRLAESQELEDEEKVGLLVKKYFRKMKRGQRKGTTSLTNADFDKGFRKGNKQKSYITWSESDFDEEDNKGEILNNFVALMGVIKEDEGDETLLLRGDFDKKIEFDSDGEEAGLSMEDQIGLLIQTVVQKTQDNSELSAERDTLQMNVAMLSKELSEEKAKSLRLEKQLEEQLKNIRMLSKGSKDLDNLLNIGQSSTAKWGMGYQGIKSEKSTQFVRGQNTEPKLKEQHVASIAQHYQLPKVNPHHRRMTMQCELPGRQSYGSHNYQQEKRMLNYGFYPAVRSVSQGYVRKDDLYS
ncbi:PREDICTED: uncharacterized protein LOC104728236 [Camelina sativa]|uniref:Uncharacterized protein LOC104728236 n=1 Tax=Camelina sativa TaxID=90675 RepID=A0ABM0USI3_CAMSA|nr:PREDICTED: uncharacterized protein LOC104728236 [Camelina sativa]